MWHQFVCFVLVGAIALQAVKPPTKDGPGGRTSGGSRVRLEV
ncbi:MAG TPA: hypothetical protein V6C57_06655 [Coleofasciculaceae cyanobacterium]